MGRGSMSSSTPAAGARADAERPWCRLPKAVFPLELRPGPGVIDDTVDLPPASAVTVAEVLPDGVLRAWRWRATGRLGFYPASSIKWITAAMAVLWLDRLGLHSTATLCPEEGSDTDGATGKPPPVVFRDALLAMLTHSDNAAFNVLQEAVGFRETFDAMQAWGCRDAIIRRNFERPRRTDSRAFVVRGHDGKRVDFPPRPNTALPLSGDTRPPPLGNPESNYATPDDLVRCAAATLMGPTRDAAAFDLIPMGLACPQPRDIALGLGDLAGTRAGNLGFTVLSKPGWWPPDRANVELAYVHEHRSGRHFFACIFVQAEEAAARAATRRAAAAIFDRLFEKSSPRSSPGTSGLP